ncbi:MAG: low specificity L-threonine aldolase [Oscillospiraceae bacterium]|nr:low specificity L-threonine aldolase [Oscillospiraceae bacterium]
MISFESDYIEGAHPRILQRLTESNLEQLPGYGTDLYCASARKRIKAACACPDGAVHFLVGGTQTNLVVIAALLQSYEGVIAAKTGHINVHEAGAIEYTGHKVLELPQHAGKLSPSELLAYLQAFYQDETHPHMVFPGMVYISHPTEYGTLYTKEELTELSNICRAYEIPLFLDGARLGYGLASLQTDVTLSDIAALCDVFSIGGTKVGALCGEAVVFPGRNAPLHFLTIAKQHGALLAKGRLLGIQFDTLFTDRLYWKISRHAIEMAEQLKQIFREKNYPFYLETPTNQQFILLENRQMENLKQKVGFSFWQTAGERHTVVRFATSWATKQEDMDLLRTLLSSV